MNQHLINHGDGVRDVAFTVDNSEAVYENAVKEGAVSIMAPTKLEDKDGFVVVSSIKTYGDTTHTFIERTNYNGLFLPGFVPHYHKEAINTMFNPVKF